MVLWLWLKADFLTPPFGDDDVDDGNNTIGERVSRHKKTYLLNRENCLKLKFGAKKVQMLKLSFAGYIDLRSTCQRVDVEST